MKKFRKRTTHNLIEKIHAHNRLDPRGFHLINVLGKGHKLNASYYIAEILEPLSQWRSIEAAATSENCWCMRTMPARIPPSYQLNILTKIE
jgi:hypothetical protein